MSYSSPASDLQLSLCVIIFWSNQSPLYLMIILYQKRHHLFYKTRTILDKLIISSFKCAYILSFGINLLAMLIKERDW